MGRVHYLLAAVCMLAVAFAGDVVKQKTFAQVEEDETTDKLVLFYKPTTSDGQELYDVFEGASEQLAVKFEDRDFFFWAVNCEDDASAGTCSASGLDNHIFFNNGDVGIDQYVFDQNVEDLVKYVELKFIQREPELVKKIASQSSFFSHLDSTDKPCFVKFFQPWCTHCKKLAGEYERSAGFFKDRVEHFDVECGKSDDTQEFCGNQGVSSYPTLILFKGSQKIKYEESGRSVLVFDKFFSKVDNNELTWVERTSKAAPPKADAPAATDDGEGAAEENDAADADEEAEDWNDEEIDEAIEEETAAPAASASASASVEDINSALSKIVDRLTAIEAHLNVKKSINHDEL